MHPIPHQLRQLPSRTYCEWALILFTILAWVTHTLWAVAIFVWLPLVVAAWVSRTNNGKFVAAAVVLSPFVLVPLLSFADASVDYARGEATWKTNGLVLPDYRLPAHGSRFQHRTLHRTTRAPVVSSGCLVDGTESFAEVPNNVAIWLWTTTFGYMEGAYTGPYPTAEEAYADLRNSDASISLATLHSPGTEHRIGLEPELAEHLADEAFDDVPPDTDLRYAYLDDEHILLASEFRTPGEWHIYLVDLSAQRVVTAYPHHQFPPDIDDPFSAFPD